ncbi:MAG: glycosyltransferase family 39 protein, partial [Ktedonobacteraceae bacterium]|nr:glycosyltransferase family 39 protein [Ktedonobacteraceae bacterium]
MYERRWHHISLVAILLLAAFLNFFQLQLNGYGNMYYAAAVKSMLTSWHNFFFVSFDPGGFVTVDKPPLALWIQAASAKIFGFSGFSLLLPQALAGILSVYVLYRLVRRTFGPAAGLLAALALVLTPISVVMNRDNNMDTLLVLTLLLGAWCVLKASEMGSLRWLLLSVLLVGLGFNMKTLEAYLIVPAFGLLYLLGSPLSWGKRAVHLLLALLVLLVVSLSWLVAVDLTPASQRPYIGSSQANSEIELALGYNGLQRLTGMSRPGGDGGNRNVPPSSSSRSPSPSVAPAGSNLQPPSPSSGAPGGPGGGGANNPFSEGGSPSIL